MVATGCMPAPAQVDGGHDAGAWFEAQLAGCTPETTPPTSVDDVIAMLNRLPRPIQVRCFVASLPRPLSVVASSSVFSAQPAGGPNDPRIFILSGPLVISVVAAGAGSTLIELGEAVDEKNSLKAEAKFPLDEEVTREHFYAHLARSESATMCGFCHRREIEHPAHPMARVSLAYRPTPYTLVPLEKLRTLASCDLETERERCLFYAALFEFGPVQQGRFPTAYEDFLFPP